MIKGPTIDDVTPLDLWVAKPMQGISLHILSKKAFRTMAATYGMSDKVGAFAVWKWWQRTIYVMPHTLHLIPHEIRHLQERRNFHSDKGWTG